MQPQSNPYGSGLYGSQQGTYDDMGGYGLQHPSGHQHQGSVGAGLPSSEYGKQLYGAQGGMQGFMGLGGQSTGSPGGAQLAGRGANNGSPEAAYKYGQGAGVGVKDVSGASGVGAGAPQGRGGIQQPQHAFYGGNRFGAAGTPQSQGQQQQAGGHQPQGQGPQGHLAYSQGSEGSAFYGYQPRQQQYWQ